MQTSCGQNCLPSTRCSRMIDRKQGVWWGARMDSEHSGFQFSGTIARLPGSLTHSFSACRCGNLTGWWSWELGRMWVRQEVKRALVLSPVITNWKPKPSDNASVRGIGACRDAKIWDDSWSKQWQKKDPSKEIMTCQSQHWLLGGTRLEAGGGRERSRMVKGSEAKLVRKRKQTLQIFFYFPPPSLPHPPCARHFGRKEQQ